MKKALLSLGLMVLMISTVSAVCDPIGGTCDTNCGNVTTYNTSAEDWLWDEEVSCVNEASPKTIFYNGADACKVVNSFIADGLWDNMTTDCVNIYSSVCTDRNDIVCPSYEYLGRQVEKTDCSCWLTQSGFCPTPSQRFYGWCVGTEDFSSFNFTDPFFAGSGGGPTPVASSSAWSQVFWYTAENVAHSIMYGVYNESVVCTQTSMFYVEDSPINGIEDKINATTDSSGQYPCQNTTQGVITVSNDGSVGVNITMVFNQITSGVRPKVGYSNDGWKGDCTGVCNSTLCDLTSDCIQLDTGGKQIIYNLGQNSTRNVWLWADFKGVGGTDVATKGNLTTNATKS